MLRNARIQEGEEPAETPAALIVELENVARELVDLIKRINKTNSTTVFADGGSIADALAERDVLVLRRSALADLAVLASTRSDRITRSEVKYLATVNVAETQERADELAKTYRELDARIQEMNWQTELVD